MGTNKLIHARLDQMLPTQISVGMREVLEKRAAWKALSKRQRQHYLDEHVFPVVVGPTGLHILDHHHLGHMLLQVGVTKVIVRPLANLQALDDAEFWSVMDFHRWAYPYDQHGERRAWSELPTSLLDMVDDPYRSLAGDVRRGGGFSKDSEPFAEFLWANFFRRRIGDAALKKSYRKALQDALKLAHSDTASFLPGWSGHHEDLLA